MGSLQASEEYLYALDRVEAVSDSDVPESYLSRMPLSGGPFTRLAPKRLGNAFQLQIADDLFFYKYAPEASSSAEVIQGTLREPESAESLVSLPASRRWDPWVGSPGGVFWTDGDRIYRRLIAVGATEN